MAEFDRDNNNFEGLLLSTLTKIETEFEFKDKEFECWERFILVKSNALTHSLYRLAISIFLSTWPCFHDVIRL